MSPSTVQKESSVRESENLSTAYEVLSKHWGKGLRAREGDPWKSNIICSWMDPSNAEALSTFSWSHAQTTPYSVINTQIQRT